MESFDVSEKNFELETGKVAADYPAVYADWRFQKFKDLAALTNQQLKDISGKIEDMFKESPEKK